MQGPLWHTNEKGRQIDWFVLQVHVIQAQLLPITIHFKSLARPIISDLN